MSDLADFVLDALRQAGGLLDSPAYDVYDVLLPEEVSRRWQVPAFQRLTFAAEAAASEASPGASAQETAGVDTEQVIAVGYGHPLVETLIEEMRTEPACVQSFVDGLRTDKRGLFSLARQTLFFPNARLSEIPHHSEFAATCHYARFNFKAALITDEKREQLVSVVMDVQAGFAMPELAQFERLARLENEPPPGSHLPAPVRWLSSPGDQGPLGRAVLDGLLERAVDAALQELATPLEALRRRAARYLELDRARLNEYYDGIIGDLKRRLDRASDAPQEQAQRRATLEDKLAATEAEREAKLADVEAKYHPRVELELINLQFIHQPKVLLPVHIGNRSTTVERIVVWDPLLHRLEPLACDVCGRAATRLVLCSGGHLAHEDCLLPEQCVDCKRVYCRLCANQMSHCVVCDRPVCVPSLNHCTKCGRATCREHVGLCHAAGGLPVRPSPTPVSEPVEEPLAPVPVSPPPAEPQVKAQPSPPRDKVKARSTARPAAQKATRPGEKTPTRPATFKIEVYADPEVPAVNAFVLTRGAKEVAIRSWEWTGQDIAVACLCEKGRNCPANGKVLVPAGDAGIEAQIRAQIEDLRREYGIPTRRVLYHVVIRGTPQQVPRLTLLGEWTAKQE